MRKFAFSRMVPETQNIAIQSNCRNNGVDTFQSAEYSICAKIWKSGIYFSPLPETIHIVLIPILLF
jgi:hypothetical protein